MVDFYDGTAELGSATLVAGKDQVTYTLTAAQTAALSVGSYSFSATYLGDNSYLTSSTTTDVALTVTQATATLLLSNLAQTYTGAPSRSR